jgi:hypothetical protein
MLAKKLKEEDSTLKAQAEIEVCIKPAEYRKCYSGKMRQLFTVFIA